MSVLLRNVLRATSGMRFATSDPQKWSEHVVLFAFGLGFATTGALFRHLKFQKCPGVFYHFDFETCIKAQRRALSRHLNFQKRSEHEVL